MAGLSSVVGPEQLERLTSTLASDYLEKARSRRRSQSFDRVQPKLGQIADWAREARRIRGVDTSAFEYSMGLPGSPRGGQRGDVSTYVTTGSALWMRANAEERLKLIDETRLHRKKVEEESGM